MENGKNDLKLALVTGSSIRLGRGFALRLAELGYAIILHYNTSESQVNETENLIKSNGGEAYHIQADFRDEGQIHRMWNFVDTLPGQLKVLINCAALITKQGIMDLKTNDLDEQISINLKAPLICSQEAAIRMEDGSVIINISDAGVNKFWTGYSGYLISKSALEMMTRLMAKKLAPKIRVNAIAPGLVLPLETISGQQWQDLLDKVPMKRAATIDEITSVGELIINNQYITGQIIQVDGGMAFQK